MLPVDRVEFALRFADLAGIQVGKTLGIKLVGRIGLGGKLGNVQIGIACAGREKGACGTNCQRH